MCVSMPAVYSLPFTYYRSEFDTFTVLNTALGDVSFVKPIHKINPLMGLLSSYTMVKLVL